MPVKLRILKQYGLIVGFQSGRVESEDAYDAIRRVFNDPDFAWDMDRIYLIDDKADMSQVNLSGMRGFRDEVLRAYFGGREPDPSELPVYRIAVVCPQPGNAAIMKLYGTLLETEQVPIADLKLFDTIGDALEWLGQDVVSESEIRQAVNLP